MRHLIEEWIDSGEEMEIEGVRGYPEELVIDWIDTRTISLHGQILVKGATPIAKEWEGLGFDGEEVDSATILLMKVIGSMYRFDVPASRNGWYSQGALKTNEVFRKYPLDYYDRVSLHNHSPWLQRKLLLDLYIYSKLASNMIWDDWTHSNVEKDRYWLHKPAKFEPFTVVFKKKYLWN